MRMVGRGEVGTVEARTVRDAATRGWGAGPAGMTVTTVMRRILLMAGRTGLVVGAERGGSEGAGGAGRRSLRLKCLLGRPRAWSWGGAWGKV